MNLIDKVNPELKEYVVSKIFPMYDLNGESHGVEHIEHVIRRSFEIMEEYESREDFRVRLNYDLLYVIAAYHDIADHIDRKRHHILSAQMMYDDENLDKFLTPKEKLIGKEAIEDHRASNTDTPRTIYGRIVLTADRNNRVEDFFKRRIKYCMEKHPEYSLDEMIEEIYESSVKKFGKEGYAFTKKCYMPSSKLEDYLKTINSLLQDKEGFAETIKIYYNEEKNGKKNADAAKELPKDLESQIIIGKDKIEHK